MIRRLHDTTDLVRAFPRVHFVGIGGTGMSGIAEVMLTLGHEVSGSDNADNAATRRLARLGARVMRGHSAANVLGTDCVVVSSAIREDNPELMEARSQRIPIMPRAAMLEQAADVVVEMVRDLRHMNIDRMTAMNEKLRALENEADRLMLELYREIYSGRLDNLQMFLLKEFFEILEKAIDRCREAGVVVYQIVLKNS